nr:uncharacterized mitochondrial protein AtMg00810-like [Tanacetum cinerariifolium]
SSPISCLLYYDVAPHCYRSAAKSDFGGVTDGKELLLVQIYVDDIIFAASTPELCDKFVKIMCSKFKMSMMGKISFLLGLQISQSPRGIFLNQPKYAVKSLKKFGFESCDPVDTPMVGKFKLDDDKEGKAVDSSHYHGMIGTLLYLTVSRPDLQFAICMCARYQARPTEKHLHAVKMIFRYLRGTVNQGLWYLKDSSITLTAFVDADHAGCQDTRRRASGSMQFLGDRLLLQTGSRLEKGNQRLSPDLKSNEATIQVVLDALKLTSVYNAFLITHVDYVSLLWEDLVYQVENKNAKKNNDIDDPLFNTIRVISRYQDTQIYGAILPDVLTNQDMLESKAYKEYYAFATGAVPLMAKTTYKKKAKEPVTSKTASESVSKGPRLKTQAKTKQPAKKTKPKGNGFGKMSKVPDEQEQEDTSTDEGTDTLSGFPMYLSGNDDEGDDVAESDDEQTKYENDDDESMIMKTMKRLRSYTMM